MPAGLSKTLARSMTGIEWATWTLNPWIGCTRLAGTRGAPSGCDICYAATFAENRMGLTWGAGESRKKAVSAADRARHLNRVAANTGTRFSVFSLSLGDWLDPEVDPAWRAEFLDLVEECAALDWLLLTHRPHLIGKLAPSSWRSALPAHVWPGATVDNAAHAFRWEQMRDAWGDTGRAWVSAEPLSSSLSGVDFSAAACLVVGGASNTRDARWRLDPAWVDEMIEAWPDILFFKQWGVFDEEGRFVGDKKKAGKARDGLTFDRTPWALNRHILADML